MCVIVVTNNPKKNPITRTDVHEALLVNSDGYGLAARYPDGSIYVEKGFTETSALKALDKYADAADLVFHARIATSGERDFNNLHPFAAHARNGEPRWLFHNGILKIPMPNPRRSDTWHLAKMLRGYSTTFEFIEWLEEYAKSERSKFALVTPAQVMIFNQQSGITSNGKWYSNNSAFPLRRLSPVTSSSMPKYPTHFCMGHQNYTAFPQYHKDEDCSLVKLSRRERRAARFLSGLTVPADPAGAGTAAKTTKETPQPPVSSSGTSMGIAPSAPVDSPRTPSSVYGNCENPHDDPDALPDNLFKEWVQGVTYNRVSVRDVDDDEQEPIKANRLA